jgi:hypothetical protein
LSNPCVEAYDGAPMGVSKSRTTAKVQRNTLGELDLSQKEPLVKTRNRTKPRKPADRVAKHSREGRRVNQNRLLKLPPVPKNKSLAEISEMDAHDEAFRHPQGRRTKYDGDPEEMTLDELIRKDHQDRNNGRRAEVRKYESMTVKAVEVLDNHTNSKDHKKDIYDEDLAVAEGLLNLEDWDLEELIRGYRRGRSGKFGTAPKYIPREVQQQAFRVLISRGNRELNRAYVQSVMDLVQLAQEARSEKVRLEAIKEIQNRVVGKVPDKVQLTQESPYETILADAFVPIDEVEPLDLEMDEDGTARMLPDVDGG